MKTIELHSIITSFLHYLLFIFICFRQNPKLFRQNPRRFEEPGRSRTPRLWRTKTYTKINWSRSKIIFKWPIYDQYFPYFCKIEKKSKNFAVGLPGYPGASQGHGKMFSKNYGKYESKMCHLRGILGLFEII